MGLVCLVKLTADERLSCGDSKLLVIQKLFLCAERAVFLEESFQKYFCCIFVGLEVSLRLISVLCMCLCIHAHVMCTCE